MPLTLGGEKIRFSDFEHYTVARLEQNLEDYFLSNNRDLLVVDWYDIAEEVKTDYGHINEDPNDVVFFMETIVNNETGEILTLYITDNRTRVDILEIYHTGNNTTSVRNVSVKYSSDVLYTRAMFEYNKNVYYLNIDVGNAQERLTEIIESMLP